jgi:hypothetical protein
MNACCGHGDSGAAFIQLLSGVIINSWQELLELAEDVAPPEEQPSDSDNWCTDVVFKAADGWKVVIFYDCGELDYISHFVAPGGKEIDFWEWPEAHPWRSYLINWRGVGDLERLKKCEQKTKGEG